MTVELIRAQQFSIQELVDAYNQTRADYMVPMPMDAARLKKYIRIYDVDLAQSLVARENGTLIGLGMLGVRPGRSWVTRLGLVASQRGRGYGRVIMEGLLENSDNLNIPQVYLEVIKGNKPAHNLSLQVGFEDVRELLILRRAPNQSPTPQSRQTPLSREEILSLLNQRTKPQAWTNQTETIAHLKGLAGFQIDTPQHGEAWLAYQHTPTIISHLMFDIGQGDPVALMRELLAHLHHNHPELDTHTENIPADAPHLPAFKEFGYIEAFHRIEMYRFPEL